MEKNARIDQMDQTEFHKQRRIESLQEKNTTLWEKFSQKNIKEKETLFSEAYIQISTKISHLLEGNEMRQEILKLKLARYLQGHQSVQIDFISQALEATPGFLDKEKGSLERALQMLEKKELIKIAEQRNRVVNRVSSQKDSESLEFNPTEALFTTSSGQYMLTRLLNMPHLEKESEFMNHCIGRSNSYINRMKKGKVEIFSLRHIPKIIDGKLTEEGPVVTIAYDKKDNCIEQLRLSENAKLDPDSEIYPEVIEALGALWDTIDDKGDPRHFEYIEQEEVEKLTVSDGFVLTRNGLIPLQSYDLERDGYVIKIPQNDILFDPKRMENSAYQEQILKIISIRGTRITLDNRESIERFSELVGGRKIKSEITVPCLSEAITRLNTVAIEFDLENQDRFNFRGNMLPATLKTLSFANTESLGEFAITDIDFGKYQIPLLSISDITSLEDVVFDKTYDENVEGLSFAPVCLDKAHNVTFPATVIGKMFLNSYEHASFSDVTPVQIVQGDIYIKAVTDMNVINPILPLALTGKIILETTSDRVDEYYDQLQARYPGHEIVLKEG